MNGTRARSSLGPLENLNTPLPSKSASSVKGLSFVESMRGGSSKANLVHSPDSIELKSSGSSSDKENVKAGSLSPISTRKEVTVSTPRSVI